VDACFRNIFGEKMSQSILIFDTVEPYIYETVPILFFPEGFTYEARFRTRHVHREKLRSWFPGDIKSRKTNDSAIICIRSLPEIKTLNEDELEAANENNKVPIPSWALGDGGDALLSPIRYVTIVHAELHGDIVLVRYQLGPYFHYNGDSFDHCNFEYNAKVHHHHQKIINENVATLARYLEFRKIKDKVGGGVNNLLHLFDFPRDKLNRGFFDLISQRAVSKDEQRLAWASVVSVLSRVPFICETPLFRITEIIDTRSEKNVPVERGSFIFRSDRSYLLRVAELLPEHSVKEVARDWVLAKRRSDLLKRALSGHIGSVSTANEAKNTNSGLDGARLYSLKMDGNFRSEGTKQMALGQYDFLEFVVATLPDTQGRSGHIELEVSDNRILATKFIAGRIPIPYKIRDLQAGLGLWLGFGALVVSAALSSVPFFDGIVDLFKVFAHPGVVKAVAMGLSGFAMSFGAAAIAVYWIRKL
jgi:hypothetical protein